jgi:hypothetical protein
MPTKRWKVLWLHKGGFVCNYSSISTNNNKWGYTLCYGFELKCETQQIDKSLLWDGLIKSIVMIFPNCSSYPQSYSLHCRNSVDHIVNVHATEKAVNDLQSLEVGQVSNGSRKIASKSQFGQIPTRQIKIQDFQNTWVSRDIICTLHTKKLCWIRNYQSYDLAPITGHLCAAKIYFRTPDSATFQPDVLTYVFSCKQKGSHFTGYILRDQLPYVTRRKLWGLTYSF